MSNFTFAFITPSYAPDFQRCKLLCWSIKKFVSTPVKHYIIVDKQDMNLFQQLADSNTEILNKENILPSWIKRVPFASRKNVWLNIKGYKSGIFLLRGWLVQQIVKLAAAQYVEQEVLIFVDSDVAFIDSFDVHTFIREDKVRLFRVEHSTDNDSETSKKWKNSAKKLLGLPLENNYYDFYVSQIVTWRRDNLLQLYKLIEKNFQRDWIEIILRVKDLSEYILYGIFTNYVLGEKSGHYDDHLQKICWCYWEETPMSHAELREFFKEAQSSGHKAIMISAKSYMDMSIEQFQNFLSSSLI
ncbi:MAG: hypothetical protein JOZ78_12220 [Chroococcidiopsidaceae cyanobacterium CP_BM_ER_R8_30]|nr:hypothetical protein [Chroococcidiopsidaceae cyanobacterium CP_BM_ER_R8_30]